mmetsp:Transcript_309/g.632  ORF Transcript_309/g.632 Transcript_309/m.632 type:complete len:289 (-) Transcript_309:305-1171(-)
MISFEEENEDLLGSHKSPYFWEEPDPWYYQLRDVIYDDCVFAYSQTRDTILDFSGDQAYYKLAWYLRYNPVYWAAFAVCSTSLFVGKRAHDFLHQGERVRLDETEAEHDTRIMWIYPTDGVACMLAMMDLALIAYMGDGGVFQSATGTDDLLSLVITSTVFVANCRFYAAMKNRNAWEVKMMIVTNVVYATSLTVILSLGISEVGWFNQYWTLPRRITFFMRVLQLNFIIAGACTTASRLWYDYDEEDHRHPMTFYSMVPAALLLGAIIVPVIFIVTISARYTWYAIL